ncbi:DUF547 domain-containing protein [Hoeflea olei]|uniref:DUF547 domain-containing protein n=1 Tax=Hoeflea olei TaxID=1480615 RepID=A0A1C1YYC3_9HYPH|nr:DUF547 domain-containing protein [Hoeflea olei]OCW58406.1 hypothetical protein AWJ14_13875 [Hoeflea olei]
MPIARRTVLSGFASLAAAAAIAPVAAGAAITAFRPRGQGSADHAAFDALLAAHVRPDPERYNRVDYRGLKADLAALRAYLAFLEALDPVALSPDEAHAYWINLYNARTLEVVADAYPVTSIRKINLGGSFLFGSGPWRAKLVTVNGRALSLDDIEHEIVRGLFRDPMSHYGLNCASYSCPNLAARAYTGATLAALLRQNAVDYVNHPRGVAIGSAGITASKIYSWYAGDFGGASKLKAHWTALATPEKAARIAPAPIVNYAYDWRINAL